MKKCKECKVYVSIEGSKPSVGFCFWRVEKKDYEIEKPFPLMGVFGESEACNLVL